MSIFSEMDMEKNVDREPEIIDEFARIPKTEDAEFGDTNVLVESASVTPEPETVPKTETVEVEKEPVDEKPSEDQKRKEHEESEAKRKAEWEAKQKEKQYAELKALQELRVMTDDTVMSASVKKIGGETDRLTRRNMKDCVSEHIQTKSLDDPAFARQTMHPRKNMINCFKYITRHALEYIKAEFEANGEQMTGFNMGSDVPDDLCYQWAEKYFTDMDAEEDKDKSAEFVPKTYYGGSSSKTKKSAAKKADSAKSKKEEKKPADTGQLSLMGPTLFDIAVPEEKAVSA